MFSSNVVFEELVPRSVWALPLINPFFHLWSVTEGEMRVLKCLGRFKVCADVSSKGGRYRT